MTDLFNEDKSKENDKPNIDDLNKVKEEGKGLETYLELILNDDGKQKYTTPEEALKGSVHAQSHIVNLEKELRTLREDANSNVSMEKVIEALNKKGEESKEKSPEQSGITIEAVAELINQTLSTRETQTTHKDNVTTVTGIFREKYGEKASETMYGKAEDLGFTRDGINELIATNPKAALNVLGVTTHKAHEADPTTSNAGIDTTQFQNNHEEALTSSMGYVSEKELTSNWEKSKAETLKRLGITIDT